MNDYYTIDDLPFTDEQKKVALEWLAQKISRTINNDDHMKSYDPLTIKSIGSNEVECSSYVFGFHDEGRGHTFRSLRHLENGLLIELKEEVFDIASDWGELTPNKKFGLSHAKADVCQFCGGSTAPAEVRAEFGLSPCFALIPKWLRNAHEAGCQCECCRFYADAILENQQI